LTVAAREIGVDETPRIDDNPWRHGAPVPFWALLGLAAAGVGSRGLRGTGGPAVWGAIAGTAVTTIVFYVSARYRLPLTALLSIPAGVGVAALVRPVDAGARARRRPAGALVLAIAAAWLAPSAELARSADAIALGNRGAAWVRQGAVAAAERDLRRATTLDPAAAQPWYNLGVVLEREGRFVEAIEAYGRAIAVDPVHGPALGNLGALWVRAGRLDRAVAVLERAVVVRPDLRPGWTNLIVARFASGDAAGARAAANAAADAGISIDPGLLETISRPSAE
jgi:tetratricopeptide (TPR) repeat protein